MSLAARTATHALVSQDGIVSLADLERALVAYLVRLDTMEKQRPKARTPLERARIGRDQETV